MGEVASRRWIVRLRQPESRGQHAAAVDARIDLEQPPETSHQQHCSGQQHHRQRELGDDERRADRLARRQRRRARVLQGAENVGPRKLPGRQHAEEHAGHRRHTGREEQHRDIERHFRESRDASRRHCHDQIACPDREQQSRHSAAARENDTLNQKQTRDPDAARAQRAPDAELAMAAGRSRQ